MSDQASIIAREAKNLQQGLKELLKAREPWDREVEFQRRNLQKQYLLLLLTHPYANESKDAETHLWMQTSYALISIYKQRVSNLERVLREPSGQKQPPRGQRHGPVEHRKLLQRFKQFLSNEERFWTQLVVRFQRQFALSEAKSALTALHLLPTSNTAPANDDAAAAAADSPRQADTTQSHFQFPTETHDSATPPTAAQHASQLSTLSKALVCLGDLARYREQYSENATRSRFDEGARRGGKNRRPMPAEVVKPKTYDRARARYERARDLVPDEGNASHQLAILASYQKDTFESMVHYYKALCVRASYDPAAENMANVLTKLLDAWRRKKAKNKEPADRPALHGQLRLDAFKDDLVLLHALWRLPPDQMDSTAPGQAERVLAEFVALVAERGLSIDTITKVVIMSQGALWAHRMVRGHATSKRPSTGATPDSVIGSRITNHLLALHTALLNGGVAEMDDAAKLGEEDLAMRITANFRRTLPALRLAGKWVRANLDFLLGNEESDSDGARRELWDAYATFTRRLVALFPPDRLPKLRRNLEEDTEAAGFLPLGGLLLANAEQGTAAPESEGGHLSTADVRAQEQVHPNEEQLMRIWDIWHDSQLLIDAKRTPMLLPAEPSKVPAFPVADLGERAPPSLPAASPWPTTSGWAPIPGSVSVEDDARTETTDPVGDAFRQVLSVSSDEEEEDEIVWNPRAKSPPVLSPKLLPQPGPQPLATPNANSPRDLNLPSPTRATFVHQSPSHASPSAHGAVKTTAQDLLNNVMGFSRAPAFDPAPGQPLHTALPHAVHGHHQQTASQHQQTASHHQQSASQSQLLFGGPQAAYRAGPSIWATAPDESSLGLHSRHPSNVAPHVSPLPGSHAPGPAPSQGPWAPPIDRAGQMPIGSLLPSAAPVSLTRVVGEVGHRRVPSASLSSPHAHTGFHGSAMYTSSPLHAVPLPAPTQQQRLGNPPGAAPYPPALHDPVWGASPAHIHATSLLQGSGRGPARSTFDGPKYGDLPQHRVGGIWGDAG
ncbi:hypothetical protein FA95DRAFT_1567117 [Auriscalpium vulgare]|uniref:Uncharacterized protein n=1 Tax=Auriscalpium vulgare TaxID=40419 RepID=A0ACB8R601_9AGAM|nr:hypothetical protein FA95DRAFT_1567117 [Auriscalpium vulgare]